MSDLLPDTADGTRPHRLAGAAAVLFVLIAVLLLNGLHPPAADVNWLLTAAERLVTGGRLYVDVIETNPPLSVWLYVPAAALARLAGVSTEIAATLMLVGLTLAALAVARSCLGSRLPAPPTALLLLALLLTPRAEFLQRDHVALIAVLPLIAATTAAGAGRRPPRLASLAAGIGGGLTMAIKPHFALAVLLVALVAAVRRRSLAPVFALHHWVAGALVLIYWAIVALTVPTFLSVILPLDALVYLPERLSLPALIGQPAVRILGLAMLAALVLRRFAIRADLTDSLLAAAAGFFVAYLLQGKGWSYQLLPALLSAVLAVLFGLDGVARRRADLGRLLRGAAALVLATPPVVHLLVATAHPNAVETALAGLPPGARLMTLSGDLMVASPAYRRLGAEFVNSTPALWRAGLAIPRLAGADPDRAQQLQAAIDAECRDIRDDLVRGLPDVVLAHVAPIDFLALARRDPVAAGILDGYEVTDVITEGGNRLEILRRKP